MNEKIFETLAFDQIRQKVSAFTVTLLGKEKALNLLPASNYEDVQRQLHETKDGMDVLRLRNGLPIPQLENIRPHMQRIKMGANLNGRELAQVSRVLQATSEVRRFIEQLAEAEIEFHYLYEWKEQLQTIPELTQRLKTAIEEDGRVTDQASDQLRQVRQQIRRSEQEIRSQLEGIIRGKQAKYLSDTLITMRNERYVIPVKQENRDHFGGVVHDQSASGQTLFIEPKQVVDLNNRLRQLHITEHQEIERILAELSEELMPYRTEILNNALVLGELDFIQAKALYAKEIDGIVPNISKEQHVCLEQARHPLIAAESVVANDIVIGEHYQTIVVTGPNTGGKTITLKTLGLLQLMGQAGLAISAAEESQIGVFEEIFADIGDEQSIEQNLSTFSSHMTNIVKILQHLDPNCLVLLDELGAGTDPQEGAALAIAILDQIAASGAYVVATTHYPELKVYGYNRPGTINASMEFDSDTLKPTYRLLIGVPGRSNAFEISKRLGLDPIIIQSAEHLLDSESQDLNEMISDLENRRKMTEIEYLELREEVESAINLHKELEEMYHYFVEEREKEQAKARKKANDIVTNAEKEAEKIIQNLRQLQAKSSAMQTEIKDHELIEAKTELSNLHQEELKKNKVLKKAKKQKELKEGSEVLVETYGQRGTLLKKVNEHTWQVQIGILKMQVDEQELTPVTPKSEPTTKRQFATVRKQNSPVPSQLDLRGKRYEEAISEVDRYLDAAILAGYSQVVIVHGKGTGALRKGITNFLKQHRSVKKFGLAPANQGGTGATIVEFK